MTINWYACVLPIVVFIEDDGEQSTKTEHGRLILNLFESFVSELVQQVYKQLLSLLISHNFSESSKLVVSQIMFAFPGLEQKLINFLLQPFVKLRLQLLLVEVFIVEVNLCLFHLAFAEDFDALTAELLVVGIVSELRNLNVYLASVFDILFLQVLQYSLQHLKVNISICIKLSNPPGIKVRNFVCNVVIKTVN